MSLSQLPKTLLTTVPVLYGDKWLRHAKNSIDLYTSSYDLNPFSFQIFTYGYLQHTGWIVAFHQNSPYWNLFFQGRVLDKSGDSVHQILEFLQAAICSTDQSRFRGPAEYQEGLMRYRSEQIGSFEDFEGREWIELDKQVIYRGTFYGGLIR